MPRFTRRAAILSAAALPCAALAPSAQAVAPGFSAEWRTILAQVAAMEPRTGPEAVLRAFAAGLDPDSYSGVFVVGRGYEQKWATLSFGEWDLGNAVMVDAATVRRWTREP